MAALVTGLAIAWSALKPVEKTTASAYPVAAQTIARNTDSGDHRVSGLQATTHFDFARDAPGGSEALSDLVAQAHELEQYVVEVEGFTDCTGSENFNKNLSRRRAERVVSYLRDQGVPAFRIHAVGLGKDEGCSQGPAEDHRRVYVSVLQVSPPHH